MNQPKTPLDDLSALPDYVPAHAPLQGVMPDVPDAPPEPPAPTKMRAVDLIRPDRAAFWGAHYKKLKMAGLVPKAQTPRGGCEVKTGRREAARRVRQMQRMRARHA